MTTQQHRKRSGHRRVARYGGAAAFLAAAAVAVLAINLTSGGSTNQEASAAGAPQVTSGGPSAKVVASSVTITPAAGATSITPDSVVTVASPKGILTSVALTTGSSPVVGTMAPDGHSWRSTSGLQASSTYRVAAVVSDASGAKATVSSSFTTMAVPHTISTATFTPSDGSTAGVGQPLVIRFAQPISAAAQASLLPHLSVAETVPVPGGWHWFSATELHLRPQAFWPTGEKLTLTADLDGWDVGGGTWGSGTLVDHVAIGDEHVSVANLQTHVMTVTDNGATVATYPISGGSSEYPTQDGIHIALDKEPVVHMVSSTVGIPVNAGGYDEYVYNDVHISDSGEYVHAAPWSVYAQGSENVSHGCINLSRSNSLAFYNFSNVGDVIEVVGGTRSPESYDHGVMDWTLDWSQWTPATITQA